MEWTWNNSITIQEEYQVFHNTCTLSILCMLALEHPEMTYLRELLSLPPKFDQGCLNHNQTV